MADSSALSGAWSRAVRLASRFFGGEIGARQFIRTAARYVIVEKLGVYQTTVGPPGSLIFFRKDLYAFIDALIVQIRQLEYDVFHLRGIISHVDHVRAEADAALAQRDAAVAERNLTETAAENVRADWKEAVAQRGEAITERDVALAQRDAALVERNLIETAAEKVRADWSAAISRRDEAVTELEAALAQRDAAITERNIIKAAAEEVDRSLRGVAENSILSLYSARDELAEALALPGWDAGDPVIGGGSTADFLTNTAQCAASLAVMSKDLHERYGNLASSGRDFLETLERRVFEAKSPQDGGRAAFDRWLAGEPGEKILQALIAQSGPMAGSRHFRAVAPALAPVTPITADFRSKLEKRIGSFKIVDVGSEPLSFEEDVYAPLARDWRCSTIGFDPFTLSDDGQGADIIRPDGRQIRTLPVFLGDGEVAQFHINRMGPTSSTLPANHSLTAQFGLLDASLETVEVQAVPTRRLDDLSREGLLFEGEIDFLKIDVQGASHSVLVHGQETLRRCLVVHVEAEVAEVYAGERPFADIDNVLKAAGFDLVDFYSLGRMPYGALDRSDARLFHPGRLLWLDAIYIYGLDVPGKLAGDKLLRAAIVMHEIYNKQDVAAELFLRYDRESGDDFYERYVDSRALSNLTDKAADET